MFRLITLISAPYFRRHWLRTLLTTGGIVLGVTVYFAIRSANDALQGALRETVDRAAGKATLQVTAGQAGFPEQALQEVQDAPGVQAAAAVVEAIVRPVAFPAGSLMIVGVDLTGDRQVREYEMEGQDNALEDPLVFLAQPDSIALNREFAARHGLQLGDSLKLQTAVGLKDFRIRGLLEPRGPARAFGGSIALMDLYAAQHVFNRGERFDRIDVVVAAGHSDSAVLAELQSRLGDGYTVESPARRGQRMQSLVQGFSEALTMTSFLALVVGVFLIFNTFAISVIQRRRDIGILRALGAGRRQIQGMIFLESLLMGLAGSAGGILAGRLIAHLLLDFMERIVSTTYGINANPREIEWRLGAVLAAALWGTAASLAGALFPARAAARVNPSLALQKGRYQALMAGENRWRNRVGLGLVAAGVAVFLWPGGGSVVWQYVSLTFSIAGLSLFVPMASHALSAMLRRPLGRFFGVEGLLASDSLIQAPRRTSATVAALLFSLAFVVASGIFTRSFKTSVVEWMEQVVNPDLVLNSSPSLAEHLYRFPPGLAERLKAIPGVRQVDCVRAARETFRGQGILVISIEMEQFYRRARQIVVEGDDEEIRRRVSGEPVVAVSDNFSRLYGLRTGDRVRLQTPSGAIDFPIVGVVRDYSSDKGTLFIDRDEYIKLWRDDGVDVFDLMIEPGENPDAVRNRVLEALRDQGQLFVLTREEFWRDITQLLDRFFLLSYVQIVVAIFVAVMGIINTLFVSITDRMREIGIFRAVGGSAMQVRKVILLEASAMVLIACLLGTTGGVYLGYFINTTFSVQQTGWYVPYTIPWLLVLAMYPVMLLVAVAAAWMPSSLAVRARLSEALAYE